MVKKGLVHSKGFKGLHRLPVQYLGFSAIKLQLIHFINCSVLFFATTTKTCCACTDLLSCFPSPDMMQLEQDTVMGLESLLVLCSQDDSPRAQATLKVYITLVQVSIQYSCSEGKRCLASLVVV